ncbi:MAG: hypothetical protein QOJ12_2303, partial [Thermoleophilales bacterium]|nr:hypothetical protein [Thermoleophilales bacterium]
APAEAAAVLNRGMARDPAERPATAGELVAALSAALRRGAAREPTAATAALPPRLPVPPPATPRGGRRWLVPALALAALAIGAALVLALAGGDGGKSGAGSSAPTTTTSAQQHKTTTQTTTTQPPPAAPAAAPEQSVKDMYERAAAQDYQSAWKLAGPGFRQQIGGYDGFVNTLGTLQSIQFPRLATVFKSGDSATVEFQSIATHPDRVDQCTGTVQLSVIDGQWLVEHIQPSCNQQPAGGAPPQQNPGKGPAGGKPRKQKNNQGGGDSNGGEGG